MILASILISKNLYLDPGSGSIIIQMVIAALLGAGVIIRSQWKRIKGWFGMKENETDADNEDEETNGK